MTFTTSSGKYRLSFHYGDMFLTTGRKNGLPIIEKFRMTEAVLYQENEVVEGLPFWEEVTVGVALCSPRDQFKKEQGRQLSLRRLADRVASLEPTLDPKAAPGTLICVEGDRELRGAVLAAYFNRRKTP